MSTKAEKYAKLTGIEHILLRPEMYIGSVESASQSAFVYNPETKRMEWTAAVLNPGLLKIIDEILLNASDNILNSSVRELQTYINVQVNPRTCETSVQNDGAGIPIRKHTVHSEFYVPELIFGHLLSGSNFTSDADAGEAAGRHGYGAKLTNVFSKSFKVECVGRGKRFFCKWASNMGTIETREVQRAEPEADAFTKISFVPELSRFGMTALSIEMFAAIHTRVVLLAAAFPDVKVSFNGHVLPFGGPDGFREFCAMFGTVLAAGESAKAKLGYVVAHGLDPSTANSSIARLPARRCLSMVNGVVTSLGGTHVSAAYAHLDAALHGSQKTFEEKGLLLSTPQMHRCIIPVIVAKLVNPKFDSQSKTRLVSEAHLKLEGVVAATALAAGIGSSAFVASRTTSAVLMAALELNKELAAVNGGVSNTDFDRSVSIRFSKVMDAPRNVKTVEPRTLILTEGDSAKALVVNSLSSHQRKYCGVFPLRGKIVNARNNPKLLRKSKELLQLFSVIGIRFGEKYKTVENLRYQRLLIATDQDADGSHIRGLLFSMLELLWPSLTGMRGFINVFMTPLIRTSVVGSPTILDFYSTADYEAWRAAHSTAKHTCKYYKGLGTFTTAEGKQYFQHLESGLLPVAFTPEGTMLLRSAFDGTKSAWRKTWSATPTLQLEAARSEAKKAAAADPARVDPGGGWGRAVLDIGTFVNRDMWAFAAAGNRRAIPHIVDGLKPSQRKVLWAMLRKPGGATASAVKVAQLSGYVSESAGFHHGELSLQETIVRMAQDFTGSNNINYLVPEGQFGSRLENGQDSAAARYIFTKLTKTTRLLFLREDEPLLTPTEEDGEVLEPKHYVPVISTLLCNGAQGIGIGFASSIPSYHPMDIITATRRLLRGEPVAQVAEALVPWAVGYVGQVVYKPCTGESLDDMAADGASAAADAAGEDGGDGAANLPTAASGATATGYFYETAEVTVTKLSSKATQIHLREVPTSMSVSKAKESLAKALSDDRVVAIADFSGGNHVDMDLTVSNETVQRLREKLFLDPGANTAINSDLVAALGLRSRIHIDATTINDGGCVSQHGQNIGQILEAHHAARLALYVARRAQRLQTVDTDIAVQQAVVGILDAVLAGAIKIGQDFDAACKARKYPLVNDSYHYLTHQPISFFSAAKLANETEKLAELQREKTALANTPPAALWAADLDRLESVLAPELRSRELRVLRDMRNAHGLTTPMLPQGLPSADVPTKGKKGSAGRVPPIPPSSGASSGVGSSSSSSGGGGGGEMLVKALAVKVEKAAVAAASKLLLHMPRFLLC